MKVFKTISAVLLAFLVLVSSTSFVVGIHLCRGKVQHVALFTKAEACAKEKKLPPCHRHLQNPCCEDEIVVHKGEDLKASAVKLEIQAPSAIHIDFPLLLIAEIIPDAPVSRAQYYNYDPPLLSSDLTIEHQVFLI